MTCGHVPLALVCFALVVPTLYSQSVIQPDGQAEIQACISPPPILPVWIEFYTDVQDYSGYHNHTGGRPKGTANPSGASTDFSGCARSTFSVPQQISGNYTVTASGGGFSGSVSIAVYYRQYEQYYLDALPPYYSYQLVGETGSHPTNHYGTFSAVVRVQEICTEFYNATGGLRAGVNDMSLPLGGLFDIGPPNGNFWQSPHTLHRRGLNADMPFQYLGTLEQREMFRQIASAKNGSPEAHPPNAPNHWHLGFPD